MIKTKHAMILVFLFLLSACGKNIPAIDSALLQSKHSVLFITKPGLSESAAAVLQKTLVTWRDGQHVSYEWMPNVETLDQQKLDKINSTAYDYIVVVGNALNRQAAEKVPSIENKNWIFLDDSVAAPISTSDPRILWKQAGADFTENQWQEWVSQQQSNGSTLEWITNSANPIPSAWAPSEEAEYISLSDAEGWYPQFQLQVRKHRPNWIVVYSPLEPAVLQRIKTLQVPIMNISSTSIDLQWEPILASLLDTMSKPWTPGVQNYGPQEITVSK